MRVEVHLASGDRARGVGMAFALTVLATSFTSPASTPIRPHFGSPNIAMAATDLSWQSLKTDLASDDWQPLRPQPYAWASPCFASSFLTGLSVQAAWSRGLFFPFGVGPLLVLLSSINYWHNPRKESRRRAVDLVTVRTGLAVQVVLACFYCRPAAIAMPRLLFGYALGALCYAAGRILVVRGHVWAGHVVHCGVHIFANLGNLLILPFAVL